MGEIEVIRQGGFLGPLLLSSSDKPIRSISKYYVSVLRESVSVSTKVRSGPFRSVSVPRESVSVLRESVSVSTKVRFGPFRSVSVRSGPFR